MYFTGNEIIVNQVQGSQAGDWVEKSWRTKERTEQPTERSKSQDVYVIQIALR